MKTSRGFIMTILSLLAVLIVLQLSMPHKYVWLETHDGNDSEPYGCMVFDSVMRSSMQKGYEVTDKKLNQIADGRHNVLIAAEKLNLSETEADALKRMLNNGATVMIAVTNFLRDETDSILAYDYGVVHCNYLFRDVSNLINQNNDNDYRPYTTIFYDKSNGSTPEKMQLYDFMFGSYLICDEESEYREIAHVFNHDRANPYARIYFKSNQQRQKEIMKEPDEGTRLRKLKDFNEEFYKGNDDYNDDLPPVKHPVAIEKKVGKGRLIVVASALPFSNYGILSRRNTRLTSLLMAELADKPTLRSTKGTSRFSDSMLPGKEEKTPLNYVFSQPSLTEAWQLMLFTILLFLIFNARRRQRVIPVYKAPRNHNIEFVKLIGTLYWQRHDNNDLLQKKYATFVDAIRHSTAADITNIADDEENSQAIAALTGMPHDRIIETLKQLRFLVSNELQVSDSEMKKAIDSMNEITRKLS